ncbi:MAG: SAM-dependent DNA methyltransferase [Candidatus Electrothrix sp. EH2]|nr:SAM-dependent DNA methyltransferase [Candidatus Electrothrix sp. EH2]
MTKQNLTIDLLRKEAGRSVAEKSAHKEFGDFQTPAVLADQVSQFIQTVFPAPEIIVEPTCGLGSFLQSCINLWNTDSVYHGFDINPEYIEICRQDIAPKADCHFETADFFQQNWRHFFSSAGKSRILVIGNPPWVTNSALGTLKSGNLPRKNNFQRLKGFAAKTGKANFDIAEWILINLLESLQHHRSACVAMLCKTATARKVLKHAWTSQWNLSGSSLHRIDAKKYFNAAVDACLFVTFISPGKKTAYATVYQELSYEKKLSRFGLHGKELIANIDDYTKYSHIEGSCSSTWRSGIKHDAAKVMELTAKEGKLINGFHETVAIEGKYLYPLLKSSDLGNNRSTPRKYVLITQQAPSDSTEELRENAPETWAYLKKYSSILDGRKSSIYKKRDRFSIFGIGKYSFTPWKVAISALYKKLVFVPVGNIDGKPIMVDDTCYFIPCDSEQEAFFLAELLNSEESRRFLHALIFFDAKRPVNVDILKRIGIGKLADFMGMKKEFTEYCPSFVQAASPQQLLIF